MRRVVPSSGPLRHWVDLAKERAPADLGPLHAKIGQQALEIDFLSGALKQRLGLFRKLRDLRDVDVPTRTNNFSTKCHSNSLTFKQDNDAVENEE